LPQRLVAHAGHEVAHDGEGDIGLEQREPYLAQHFLRIGLRQPRLAPHLLDDAGKSVRELIEHFFSWYARGI
jgi:hypothetical protein